MMYDSIASCVRSFSLAVVLVGFWLIFLPARVWVTLYPAPTQEAIQAAIYEIAGNPRIDGGTVKLTGGVIPLDRALKVDTIVLPRGGLTVEGATGTWLDGQGKAVAAFDFSDDGS